jgi:signal transduction histidine kinase
LVLSPFGQISPESDYKRNHNGCQKNLANLGGWAASCAIIVFVRTSIVISRTLAWFLTVAFLGGIYACLFLAYRTFVSSSDLLLLAWTILYGILVGHSFERIRLFLQTSTDRAFVIGWYNYRVVQRILSSGLARAMSKEDIIDAVFYPLDKQVDIKGIRFFFHDKNSSNYIEFDPKSKHPLPNSILEPDHHLIKKMIYTKDIGRISSRDALEEKIYIPAFADGQLIAFILLGCKRSEIDYDDIDFDLFKTIKEGIETALHFKIKPYDEVKQNFEVTQRKLVEAEKQLERAQRLSSLGRIIAEVAHEVRNPLTVISSKIKKMKDKVSDEQYCLETCDLITQKCEQIVKVTKTMHTFSSPPKYEPQEIDVREPIENALRFLPFKKDIQVVKELNCPPLVLGDKDELERVFINLFTNAFDAMQDKGGKLIVRTSCFEHHENKYVKVEIVDSGVGIPGEELPKIFEPFYSTKFGKIDERMGFGLSICHNIIVEKHRGTINAESNPGKGTKFTIVFPAK